MHKSQFDRFLNLLERAVVVAEKWAEANYPIQHENVESEIYRQGEGREIDSPEAYQKLAVEPEGRFTRKYREAHPEA